VERTNQWLTLAANLGVIAGLFFLAIEIRQNTNIAKASAYRDNIQDIAAWRELTISDSELSRLFGTYLNDGIEALEGDERGRISGLINNVMGIYENAYFGRSYGIIGDEEWLRFESGACGHYLTALRNNLSLRYLTQGFREFLDETCKPELSD
jgi:hypothetical protein